MDLISRAKAIDALRAMQTYKLFVGDDMLLIDQAGAMAELMMLPSAQPELIRCGDCRRWQTIDCPFYSRYETVMPNEEQYCSLAERRSDG